MKFKDLNTKKYYNTFSPTKSIIGHTITQVTPYAGSYGMGGPGYVGLKLKDKLWLIFGLWGALDWIHYNFKGKYVTLKDHWKEYGPKFTYEPPYDGPLVGEIIQDFFITDDMFLMEFESGRELCIFGNSNTRPAFLTTEMNRELKDDESLCDLIFTHFTTNISVLE